MKIERKKNKDTTTLVCSGEFTIYHVSQIRKDLLSKPEAFTEKVALDLHQVTEIDTAGVQLLLFAKKLLKDFEKDLFISKNNESIDKVLTTLNVKGQLAH